MERISPATESDLSYREGTGVYISNRGNEMFVSRKTKSITKASVDLALEKIIELSGEVAGPKKLKCFGASYLYPIFIEMGLIKNS